LANGKPYNEHDFIPDCSKSFEGGIMSDRTDVIIIGGGPGGYVAAIRAGQLKKKVLLIEEDRVGGTCMNYGCIPTKYLLHQTGVLREVHTNKVLTGPKDQVGCDWGKTQESKQKVVDRLVKGVEFLLPKYGVELIKGRGILRNDRQVRVLTAEGESIHEADRIILASGSRAADLPFLKADGRNVVTSREALEWKTLPKSLLVIGAGAIGLEMATIYSRLGVPTVVLEMMPTVLPGSDKEMCARLERILKQQGIKVLTQMRIESAEAGEGRVRLSGASMRDQKPFAFEADKALLAVGRKPNSDSIQDGHAVVPVGRGGFIEVNESLETSVPGIYAVGDLIGGKLLAHKASHEGMAAAENIAGGRAMAGDRAMPMAVFTDPEFASVGLTEEEAKERGVAYHTGTFSLQASGRALSMDRPEGLVKVIAGPAGEVIGGHIIGPGASDWVAELTLAIDRGLKLKDLIDTVHIHPTLSESVMEAALKAEGRPLSAL
jgi:dihydrolipoamide dehydrogenase